MVSIKSMFAGIVFAMVLSLAGQQAQAADRMISKGQISQTSVIAPGTPSYETIRQFIIRNSRADQHRTLDKASAQPGSFKVVHVTVISSTAGLAKVQAGGDGSPVALPATGNDGDTLAISSCGDHAREAWTYGWVGPSKDGAWVMQQYAWKAVTKCQDKIRNRQDAPIGIP